MKPELKGLVDGLSEPEREELLTYLEGLETSSGSFQCSFPPVPDMETRHNGALALQKVTVFEYHQAYNYLANGSELTYLTLKTIRTLQGLGVQVLRKVK